MKFQLTRMLFLTILLASTAFPQNEDLANGDIVEMTRVGLSAQIILRKVSTANCVFDTSAASLIALKKEGVADEVITAMIDRQNLIPPNSRPDNTPNFSESGAAPNTFASPAAPARSGTDVVRTARTIAISKSSAHPSRQALEKELLKRPDFKALGLSLLRYKDSADLFVEIGFVPLSWITHRYVYRIYDRRSGTVIAAGETTSWGSLAENLARRIAKDLRILKG